MSINEDVRINAIRLILLFSVAVVLGLSIFSASKVSAHSGRTDAYGGHNCYVGSCAGTYHYHNDGYYVPPAPSYVCKIGDVKFYSHSEAKAYWNGQIDEQVKRIYKTLLERDTNENDHKHWYANFPYNNCKGKWDSQVIWDEVLNSDEREALIARKEEARKKAFEDVASVTAANNAIAASSPTENEDDVDWFIWGVIVVGVLIGMVIQKARAK